MILTLQNPTEKSNLVLSVDTTTHKSPILRIESDKWEIHNGRVEIKIELTDTAVSEQRAILSYAKNKVKK